MRLKDQTVAIARALGAECHVVPKNGLAFQRQYGVDLVTTELVCLVDADNGLEADCTSRLVGICISRTS